MKPPECRPWSYAETKPPKCRLEAMPKRSHQTAVLEAMPKRSHLNAILQAMPKQSHLNAVLESLSHLGGVLKAPQRGSCYVVAVTRTDFHTIIEWVALSLSNPTKVIPGHWCDKGRLISYGVSLFLSTLREIHWCDRATCAVLCTRAASSRNSLVRNKDWVLVRQGHID